MSVYSAGTGALAKARQLALLTRRRSREGHLPVSSQIAEMLWLKLRRGIGPGYYHVAAFWRRDLPWAEKDGHLGAGEYLRRLAVLNPAEYRKLSQNKIAEKAILQLFGVPTPRFLGVFHPVLGRTPSGAPLRGAGDLARHLETERAARFCLKPVEGWGGMGFQALDVSRESEPITVTPLLGGRPLPLDQYVEEVLLRPDSEGWTLEEYLQQHERMRAFNPTSVNTIRLWVLRRDGERPAALGGYLRIGRAGALVDNQTSGGIIARIDPASGKLQAATNGHVDRPEYPVHPDHGATIEGETVPFWAEAVALAESTLALFPNIRFAGFDIALAPQGPVVIELNPSPDIQGAAEMQLALRSVLRP